MRKLTFLFVFLITVSGWTYAKAPKSRSLEFNYDVILKDIPQETSDLKVWLPVLPETDYQIIEEISINPSDSSSISQDKVYKNKILNFSLKPPFDSTFRINVQYKLKRLEYSNKPGNGGNNYGKVENGEDLTKFLSASRMVTLSPRVKELAVHLTKGKETTLEKARAIYDYVFENVSYDKTIPGWGEGDTERVCDIRVGNCTDFHSLFISLSRASGIPAKFVIGVPFEKGKKEGQTTKYHCWAEFHDEQLGWIPVDISEAWKDKSKYEYHFGTIDENRLEFSQGRDIMLEPNQTGKPLNYFVYPYAEVDGKVFKKIGVLFSFKDRIDEKG